MGGNVAFDIFRQAPERLAALILIGTLPDPDTPAKRSDRLRQIGRARVGELEAMVLEELKPNYLAAQSRADRGLMKEIVEMARRLGKDVFERQSHALMGRSDSRPTLPTIDCPVVIIAGENDVLCPPEIQRAMHAAIPHSALHLLPDCGHLPTLEKPGRVNEIIDGMLAQIDAGEGK